MVAPPPGTYLFEEIRSKPKGIEGIRHQREMLSRDVCATNMYMAGALLTHPSSQQLQGLQMSGISGIFCVFHSFLISAAGISGISCVFHAFCV